MDGAAQGPRGQLGVAFLGREPTHRLHAAEEGQRVAIGDHTLFIDDAWKLRNVGKPAWQGLVGKHGAPFGETPVPERGIEEDPARSEKSP